ERPVVVADDAGGAIVAWTDGRAGGGPFGNKFVYAQHVLASGAMDPSWPADGSALSADHGSWPDLATDGAGGAIVIISDDGARGGQRAGRRRGQPVQSPDRRGRRRWRDRHLARSPCRRRSRRRLRRARSADRSARRHGGDGALIELELNPRRNMLNQKVAFIGYGAMAEAMIGGLLRQQLAAPP